MHKAVKAVLTILSYKAVFLLGYYFGGGFEKEGINPEPSREKISLLEERVDQIDNRVEYLERNYRRER